MDEIGFLLLIGLVVLAVPVLGLVGFFRTLGLKRQVLELEARVRTMEAQAGLLRAAPGLSQAPAEAAPQDTATEPGLPAADAGEPGIAGPDQAATPAAEDHPAAEELPIAASVEADRDDAAISQVPPRPARSLEETIGTRWVVWVGGVALGLGGLFLVRYSIEQGWFGQGARIACGALFALALAGGGEWLRRRERAGGAMPALGQIPAAHIPSVLTAAATLTAFGTIYAAYALYQMLDAAPAFILLGLVGLLTMAAAALHGPALAGFGLVASYAAPALVSSSDPQPWPLVLYCIVVAAAAYGLARIRRWPWLAIAAAVGAAIWARLIMDLGGHEAEAAVHIVLQTALAALLIVVLPHRPVQDPGEAPGEDEPDWLGTGILLVFAVLGAELLLDPVSLGAARVPFAGAEAAILLVAAWLVPPVAGLLLAAGGIAVAALFGWPILADLAAETPTALPAPGTSPLPDTLWLFLAFGLVSGGAVLAAGFLRLMRSPGLPRLAAGFYAAAAILAPGAILVTAWWRVTDFDRSLPFAVAAGLLAMLHVGAARLLKARFAETGGLAPRYGTEAFAAGALGALACGLTMVLDKGSLTVALALSALGAAWVTTREPLGLLRYAVGGLGVAVAARLAWDPTIVQGDVGTTPILNWLLWGYGVPALAFGLASRMLRRQADDQVVALCEALSIAFTGLLLALQLHHLCTGGSVTSTTVSHLELGLQAVAALMMAVVLVSLEVTRRSLVIRAATYLFGGASLGIAVLGLLTTSNPLFNGSSERVQGGAVLNSLLAAYLLPALAAMVLARRARGLRPKWFVDVARALGFLLALAWVVLEIRRLFQGPDIGLWRRTSDAEFYTYSAAFLLIGLALLAVGILRGSREARLSSAAFILLAVLKAFLFDMAGLTGPYRALSFIGLGLVLVGIGLVYQKLVFRRMPGPPGEPSPSTPPGDEGPPDAVGEVPAAS